MQIIADPKARLEPGNFCARVDNGQLALPTKLVAKLDASNVATAEEFVVQLRCFPDQLAQLLEWSLQDLSAASEPLFMNLRDYVAPQILQVPAPPMRGYGARRPRGS